MTLYNLVDAARPGAVLPPGTQLLNLYVGDPGPDAPDTPHVWLASEANAYLDADPLLRFVPSVVHSYDNGDPTGSADNGCDAMERMGWAANMPGDQRRICFIDCETLVDNLFFTAMRQRTVKRGFTPILYGSPFFVTQNTSPFGYWFAAPTGRRPTSLNRNTRGVQWLWGNQWDLSVVDQGVWDGAGRGARHGG